MTIRTTRRGSARTLAILGLLAVSACANGASCAQRKVAKLALTGDAPVPVVEVRIDGRGARMVLDTGAQEVFLTPSGARRLGLREEPGLQARAAGIGGSVGVMGTTLDRLSLGSSDLHAIRAAVVDQELPRAGTMRLDGLLGMAALNHYDIDLNMAAHTATLYAGPACDGGLPRWPGMQRIAARSLNGVFVIPVKLDAHSYTAMIDSGSQSNVLFTDARGIAFALHNRLPGGLLHGVGPDATHGFEARFARLEVGSETLRDVPFVVTARRAGAPDIVLGQPFLARHRVWFSAQRRALFVAPASS
ncbi:MAG: aspartyl protease family protein [Rhodospirillales bacterium]|nr:aspartyl protease family protein [Rhodospirillales bacterium]